MWCTQDVEKVKLLVSRGADINSLSDFGNTAFLITCKGAGQTEIVKWMIANDANCSVVNKNQETALTRAAEFGDTSLLRILIEKKIDPLARERHNISALEFTMVTENWDNAEFLLNNMPDNLLADSIINGALLYAVVDDNLEIVKKLIQKAKNIDMTDHDGYTALMWAFYNEHVHPEMIEAILERNPDIGYQAADGTSALSWSLKKGNTFIVQLLQQSEKKSR